MAKKAADKSTPTGWQVGTQPAVTFPALPPERDGDIPPPLHQLVRIVAALPLHKIMSLTDAFVQVKNRLGSGELAALDLTKDARAGRLTVAARWVENGIEHVAILRLAFFQYFKILASHPFDANRPEGASVGAIRSGLQGPQLAGRWYFFVIRRRFVAQWPSPKQSQSQDDRPTTKSEPLKQLPAEKWLMARFDSKPRPGGMDQEIYLKGIHDDMQKDPTVRRVCKYKTVQNRYADWLNSPKRSK